MLNLKNLRPGEEVEFAIRRHWIIYVILGVSFITLLITNIVLFYILIGKFSIIILSLGSIVYWMIFSLILYTNWLNHELDLFIVTNNRIIGVEQISFLDRTISECNLGQVQEVNSKTSGFFANVLNYGTIMIQTAGSSATLKMEFAPDSIQGSRKILNIVDNYRDKHQNVNTFVKEETESK